MNNGIPMTDYNFNQTRTTGEVGSLCNHIIDDTRFTSAETTWSTLWAELAEVFWLEVGFLCGGYVS
jgi:hypothetical protein